MLCSSLDYTDARRTIELEWNCSSSSSSFADTLVVQFIGCRRFALAVFLSACQSVGEHTQDRWRGECRSTDCWSTFFIRCARLRSIWIQRGDWPCSLIIQDEVFSSESSWNCWKPLSIIFPINNASLNDKNETNDRSFNSLLLSNLDLIPSSSRFSSRKKFHSASLSRWQFQQLDASLKLSLDRRGAISRILARHRIDLICEMEFGWSTRWPWSSSFSASNPIDGRSHHTCSGLSLNLNLPIEVSSDVDVSRRSQEMTRILSRLTRPPGKRISSSIWVSSQTRVDSRSQLIGRESNDNYRRIITSLRRVLSLQWLTIFRTWGSILFFLFLMKNPHLRLSFIDAGDEYSEQQQLSSLQSGGFDALYRTLGRLSTYKKSDNVELVNHRLEAMVERCLSRPVIGRRWRRIESSLMGTDGSGHPSSHLWRWSLLKPIDGSIRFSIICWVRNVVGVVSMVREEYPDMGSAGMTTEERHLMDLFFDSRSSDEEFRRRRSGVQQCEI